MENGQRIHKKKQTNKQQPETTRFLSVQIRQAHRSTNIQKCEADQNTPAAIDGTFSDLR
jgi:hypothetical protein